MQFHLNHRALPCARGAFRQKNNCATLRFRVFLALFLLVCFGVRLLDTRGARFKRCVVELKWRAAGACQVCHWRMASVFVDMWSGQPRFEGEGARRRASC